MVGSDLIRPISLEYTERDSRVHYVSFPRDTHRLQLLYSLALRTVAVETFS